MSSTIDKQVQKYKECAGKGCNNKGTCKLKIRYIHKHGWFCGSCKDILLERNLVDEIKDGDVNFD